jgi:hypothetical protein
MESSSKRKISAIGFLIEEKLPERTSEDHTIIRYEFGGGLVRGGGGGGWKGRKWLIL